MGPIGTILHATDFSERSKTAFRFACSLARQCQARLHVLHVGVPPLTLSDTALAPGGVDLCREGLLGGLRIHHPPPPDVRVEYLVGEGDPADEVVRIARRRGCDLIVMGTQGRSGLGRLVMGSVTEQVLREASCPVLAVKLPAPADTAVATEAAVPEIANP